MLHYRQRVLGGKASRSGWPSGKNVKRLEKPRGQGAGQGNGRSVAAGSTRCPAGHQVELVWVKGGHAGNIQRKRGAATSFAGTGRGDGHCKVLADWTLVQPTAEPEPDPVAVGWGRWRSAGQSKTVGLRVPGPLELEERAVGLRSRVRRVPLSRAAALHPADRRVMDRAEDGVAADEAGNGRGPRSVRTTSEGPRWGDFLISSSKLSAVRGACQGSGQGKNLSQRLRGSPQDRFVAALWFVGNLVPDGGVGSGRGDRPGPARGGGGGRPRWMGPTPGPIRSRYSGVRGPSPVVLDQVQVRPET